MKVISGCDLTATQFRALIACQWGTAFIVALSLSDVGQLSLDNQILGSIGIVSGFESSNLKDVEFNSIKACWEIERVQQA
jgi:hypothetical protein